MFSDIAFDGGLEVNDRMEDATAETPACDHGEETLNGVDPGCRCRRKVKGPSGMTGEPGPDFGVLVRTVVVENGVDRLVLRCGSLDGVEKADEFLMTMLLHAAPEHAAVKDVEGREQCRRAVAFVIVGHGSAFTGFER